MAEKVILGLDVSARRTGWTLLDYLGPQTMPRVECGTWKCQGDDWTDSVAAISTQLAALIRARRSTSNRIITNAAVEAPIRRPPQRRVQVDGGLFASRYETKQASDPQTILTLYSMHGAVRAILDLFEIETTYVAAETWRKYYIGVGRAPDHVPRGKGTDWLKKQAVEKSASVGEKLGFKVPNHDAAESVGVTMFEANRLGLIKVIGKLIASL